MNPSSDLPSDKATDVVFALGNYKQCNQSYLTTKWYYDPAERCPNLYDPAVNYGTGPEMTRVCVACFVHNFTSTDGGWTAAAIDANRNSDIYKAALEVLELHRERGLIRVERGPGRQSSGLDS